MGVPSGGETLLIVIISRPINQMFSMSLCTGLKEHARSCYCTAVSAHSLLPMCTRREQARANANISSSPVNIALEPTTSGDRPCTETQMMLKEEGEDPLDHPSRFAYGLRCPPLIPQTHQRIPGIWVLQRTQKALSAPVIRLSITWMKTTTCLRFIARVYECNEPPCLENDN